MANLTITIDDDLLRRARVRAAQLDTSVNAVLREYLKTWTGDDDARARALRSLIQQARRSKSGSGGRIWTRDELHERR